jgi:vacuolar protein sorting-associated protein 13A/C
MFESVLESVLNQILGKYIEGLTAADLNVSIWNGDVKLQNVRLRADIFKQFKLPLELVFGRIGNLQVSVPWKSISSKPVDVTIDDVYIVVRKSTPFVLFSCRTNHGPVVVGAQRNE